MNWFKGMPARLKEQLKIVATNPENFEEKWSFSSSRIQLFSLVLVIFIVFGLLFSLLATRGPLSAFFLKSEGSVDRQKLEIQYQKAQQLSKKIAAQEAYIRHISKVISGSIPVDSLLPELPDPQKIIVPSLNSKATKEELALARQVKEDLRTIPKSNAYKKNRTYFSSPIKGEIISFFDFTHHPAVDIKTGNDLCVKSCSSGTILYAGYTQSDHFIVLIEHANGYTSIYKNMKMILKKTGAKVQTGDPIAFVGGSGEINSQPHLHFELWYNQTAVNPLDYLNFE
jgi:murein DD-endopeptidase MepM/ murein hydrolase activator NlpD